MRFPVVQRRLSEEWASSNNATVIANKKMNVALIGPSGVGLGTQVTFLVEKIGMVPFSTGNMLRSNLATGTALGILARNYMNQGELVPDEVVDAMVEEWLRKSAPTDSKIVFDGFPRTLYQAQFLDQTLRDLGTKLSLVVFLQAPDQTIIERLSGRLICPSCDAIFHRTFKPPARQNICDRCGSNLASRPDDRPPVSLARLRNFHRVITPVLEHYRSTNRLVTLDGRSDPASISAALMDAIENPARRTISIPTLLRAGKAQPRALGPKKLPDLVLLGGPGSGKGTQAEQIKSRFNIPHISTGDLFRDNLKRDTKLGSLAKLYMDRGELVPDSVTDAMVEERLGLPDTERGFILDGFPRTLSQAHALDEILYEHDRALAGTLYLEVPDEDIIGRLGGRLLCRNCQVPYHSSFKAPRVSGTCDVCGGELYQRADDNPETIRTRLRTFHRQTEPLINYYRADGILHTICGKGTVEETTQRVIAAVEKLFQKGSAHV